MQVWKILLRSFSPLSKFTDSTLSVWASGLARRDERRRCGLAALETAMIDDYPGGWMTPQQPPLHMQRHRSEWLTHRSGNTFLSSMDRKLLEPVPTLLLPLI